MLLAKASSLKGKLQQAAQPLIYGGSLVNAAQCRDNVFATASSRSTHPQQRHSGADEKLESVNASKLPPQRFGHSTPWRTVARLSLSTQYQSRGGCGRVPSGDSYKTRLLY